MRTHTARYLGAASLAALALALPQIARADPIALPSGGNLVIGAASVGGNGTDTVTVTQTSGRAIVEWNSFSVGTGGKATFVQPSASSATLNRVTGNDRSTIDGRIESNGKVYLVNPNGIEITSTGVVDTHGGFIGSSLDIQNNDFMGGRDNFQSPRSNSYPYYPPAAAVTNAGTIITSTAGLVALLGGSVANSGTITVPQGTIALGVGSAMTLDVNGDGFLQILMPVQQNGGIAENYIINSGAITADGGRVELRTRVEAGGSGDVVNITGSIRADSVSGAGGTIVLDSGGYSVGSVKVAGGAVVSASSSNGAGGTVTMEHVYSLTVDGSVFATGTTQGGVISGAGSYGHSYGGTYITGTLDASGDVGGRIDLSDETTVSLDGNATISARGVNGRGGLVRLGGDFLGGDAEAALDPDYAMQVTRFGVLPSLGFGAWQVGAGQATTIDVSSSSGAGGTVTVSSAISPSSAAYTASLYWGGGAIKAQGATPGSVALYSTGVISTSYVNQAFANINPGAGGTFLLAAPSFGFTDDWSGSAGTSLLHDGSLDRLLYGFGANVRLRASDGIAMDLHQEMHEPDGTDYSIATKIGDLTLQAAGSIDVRGTIDLTHLADHSDPTVAAHYAHGTLRDGAITLIANDSRITPTGAARLGVNGITVSGDEYLGYPGYYTSSTTDVLKTRFDGRSVSLSIGAGVGAAAADDPSKPSVGSIDLFGNIAADDQVVRDYQPLYSSPQSNNSRPTSVSLSIYDYGASTVALDPSVAGVQAALTPGKIILRGNTIDATTVNIAGSILLAPVDGIDQTSTIKANNFTWTNASTATIQGVADVATNSLPATLRIEGASGLLGLATVLDYGRSGSDLVALGNENVNYALGGTATRRYGDPALDLGQPLAVVRGDPVGAANTALAAGSLNVAGSDDAAGNVGVRSIAVTAVGDNAAFAPGRYGYVDLTPSTLSLQIVPVGLSLLTYSVLSPSYVYGSPLTAVKLTGIIGADDVAPSVQLNGATAMSTLVAKGGGNFAFAANTAVQATAFNFLGLTGSSAGNYFIDLTSAPTSGTLTITPRLLTASAAATSFTYGSPTASVTLGNTLAGDTITPIVTIGGSTVTLASLGAGSFGFESTRGVVNTSYTLAGISGTAAGNYTLPTNYTTLGSTLVITPKPLSYAGASSSRTYGDAVVTPTLSLTGIINNDTVSVDGVGISGGNGYVGPIAERTAAGSYSLYAVALTGAQAANYSVARTGGPSLTISPRLLTLTASDADYVYGSPTAPVSLAGLLDNDVVSVAATIGSTAATLTGVTSTVTGTVAGSVNSSSILQRTYSFATRGVTDASYTITGLSGPAAGNYALAPASQGLGAHLTITPKPLTYAAGSFTRTYGDAVVTPALQLSGIINSDVVGISGIAVSGSGGTITLAQKTPAGSYTLSATGLSGAGAANYALPSGTGPTLTINPRPVTFTLLDNSATYGSGVASVSWSGATTPLTGDDVRPDAYLYAGTGTSLADFQATAYAGRYGQYTGVGAYRVYATTLTGADAANYSYSGATQQAFLRIDPKRITLAPDAASRTYGSVTLPTPALVGVLPNDTQVQATIDVIGLNGAFWNGVDSNVGTYQVGASGLTGTGAANYELVGGTYQFSITPRMLTASFSGSTLTYGDTPSGLIQLSGLVGRDAGLVTGDVSLLDAQGRAATLSSSTNVGTYTAALNSLSGSRASNYVIGTGGSGTLTVTPRALSYSLLSASGTYGDATRFGGAILSGLANGEQANGVASLIDASGAQIATVTGANYATTSATQRAGSYALKMTGLVGVAGTGFNAANYRLAGTDATVTIAPKLVSYTLGIVQRSYGAGDASGLGGVAVPVTATLNGILASDAAAVTAQAAALAEGRFPVDANDPRLNAGTYPTTVTGLSGTAASNYKLTDSGSTQGTLIVRPLAVSAAFEDASAVYGNGLKPTAIGFTALPGDTVWVVGTLQTRDGNLTFAADGKTNIAAQTAPGAWTMSPTGLDGSQAGNYTLVSAVPATLTITPRPLTVQLLDITATYGDTISTQVDVPLIGVINGDTVAGVGLISGQPVNAGTYTINGLLAGADAYKYSIVTAPATLTINPLAIYATGANGGAVRSVYGDPLSVLFASVSGNATITPAYTLSLANNGAPVSTQRPNAGGYQATVSVANRNYSLVNPQILYIVDPRPVSALYSSVVYGDQPVLELANVMAGDPVTARAARLETGSGTGYAPWNADGSFAAGVISSASLPDAGQTYTITQAFMGGASASNYVFSGGTVTITPRPITITGFGATAKSTWGDTTSAYAGLRTTVSGAPATLYDSSGVTYSNLVFASDAAGIAPAMTTTVQENGKAVAISNADVGTYNWTPTGIAKLTGGFASDCGGSACLSSNYTLATAGNATANLQITPRTVNYASTGGTTVYGDAIRVGVTILDLPSDKVGSITPQIGFEAGGVVQGGGDSVSVGGGTYATTVVKAPVDTYKVVVASATGTAPGNIVWQAADAAKGRLTVTPREVTYTTFDGYSLYPIGPVPGSLDKLLAPQLNGLVEGDAVSAVLKVGSSLFTDFGPTFPVGAYPVSVAYLSGPDGDNYTVAATGNKQGTLTVAALRDTELNGALSLIGNNVTTNIIAGLQKAADDQAAAAKAVADATTTAAPSASSPTSASDVVYTPPVDTRQVGGSSISSNNAASLPGQTAADGSSSNNSASSTGASIKTFVTTTTDLGPIEGGANVSNTLSVSPLGASIRSAASATLSYEVSVPVGYGTLSNTTTLGAYASAQASIGVMGVKVADQAGVSLKNMVVWSGGCGSATCGASTYQEVGLIASSQVKFGKDGFGETFAAGANVAIGAGGSIGGSAGSVSGAVGASTGKFAAGLAFDTAFSGSQIKLGISATIGIGVAGVDLNLSISLTPFGSIEAYTVAVDPAATAARLAVQENLTNKAIELRFQQQQFIADLFDGKIGSVENMDARRDQLAAETKAFNTEATSQGFAVATDGGTVSVNDMNAPATMTLYRYSGGWGNTVVDAVTSDWGSTIYTPVSGGLATAVDGAKSAANKVADAFSNAANKFADLF